MRIGCRLWWAMIDSSRLQTMATGGSAGGILAVLGGAPGAADALGVRFVVGEDRLLAPQDDGAGPRQLPGGERQDVLDGEVLAPAEGAADGGVADHDLLFGQLE